MSKSLVVLLAAGALMTSIAFAAPRMMTDAGLDKVSAGASVFDFLFGSGEAAVTTAQLPAEAAAADNGGIATDGDLNDIAAAQTNAIAGNLNQAFYADGNGNVALRNNNDNNAFATGADSIALGRNNDDNNVVSGERNVGLRNDNDNNQIITGDNNIAGRFGPVDDSAIAVGNDNAVARARNMNDSVVQAGSYNGAIGDFDNNNDSFAVAGNDNCVNGIIDNDGSAVVVGSGTARTTNVDVAITDSFNVTTNTLDISGQCELTAVVNAASLAFQAIGVNLTITNAAASVPTMQGDVALSIPVIAGNALALSVLDQANVNNSILVNLGAGNININ